METKTIGTQLVYFKSFKTTLRNIGQFVGSTPRQMFEELEQVQAKISGAQIWQYEGSDGNPDTEFGLTIAIPIQEAVPSLASNIKEFPSFVCVEHIHKGSWNELQFVYPKFVSEIIASGKQPGTLCREIYHVVDFENPENNVTEIQMGLCN